MTAPTAESAASPNYQRTRQLRRKGPEPAPPVAIVDDQSDEARIRASAIRHRMRGVARQAAMDPEDGIVL